MNKALIFTMVLTFLSTMIISAANAGDITIEMLNKRDDGQQDPDWNHCVGRKSSSLSTANRKDARCKDGLRRCGLGPGGLNAL